MDIRNFINKYRLKKAIKAGLQIADDCRIIGRPQFGSEPYLITIGKHVTISGNVTFITHDGGTWVFRHLPKYKNVIRFGRINIKDNCFIGYGSIILPGVTIGENSVVGAGSVVTKDVMPNTVVAGNPAKFIKKVDDYAENCLEQTPHYNECMYRANPKEEVQRVYPKV